MAFDNIIGNEEIKNLLNVAIEKEKILHNYMFCRSIWHRKIFACRGIC